jgi:hypothetical protein
MIRSLSTLGCRLGDLDLGLLSSPLLGPKSLSCSIQSPGLGGVHRGPPGDTAGCLGWTVLLGPSHLRFMNHPLEDPWSFFLSLFLFWFAVQSFGIALLRPPLAPRLSRIWYPSPFQRGAAEGG